MMVYFSVEYIELRKISELLIKILNEYVKLGGVLSFYKGDTISFGMNLCIEHYINEINHENTKSSKFVITLCNPFFYAASEIRKLEVLVHTQPYYAAIPVSDQHLKEWTKFINRCSDLFYVLGRCRRFRFHLERFHDQPK